MRAVIGSVGIGYVGLPLAQAFCRQGVKIIGLDIDQEKIDLIENDQSYIKHIGDDAIKEMRAGDLFNVATDLQGLQMLISLSVWLTKKCRRYAREPVFGSDRVIQSLRP